MTKLEQLIQELCPNGVEYKTLGEIGNVSMCKRILKHETSEIGDVPFYKIGTFGKEANAFISFEIYEKYKRLYSFPKKGEVLISASGTIGRTVIFDGEPAYFQDSNIVWISNDETQVTNLFLYYFYQTKPWQVSSGGTIARLYNDNILRTKIPVPPLEVQAEIVRILDTFTELTKELATELANRKKQYEYYLNDVFRNVQAEYEPMEKYFPFIRNGFVGTVTSFFTDAEHGVRYLEGKNIHNGIISDNEILYVTKDFHKKHIRNELKPDDILMVQSGHVGECAVVGEKYAGANCHALIIMSNGGNINSKYVTYYFMSAEGKRKLEKITTGGTIKHILASGMKKVTIPVPPIEEQRRIVAILDRFDKLCNNISDGLPAEIEARQKQYEYYRDKLLTFTMKE